MKRFYSIVEADNDNMNSTKVVEHRVFNRRYEAEKAMKMLRQSDRDHGVTGKSYWISKTEA